MDLYESIYEREETDELPPLYDLFAYSTPEVSGAPLDDTLIVTTDGADLLVISINGDPANQQTLDIANFDPSQDSVSVLLNGAPAQDVTFAGEMLRVGGELIAVIHGADEVLIH